MLLSAFILHLPCLNAPHADTHYVDVNCASPTPPYTNWATAATTIQAAIDEAEDGDSVQVTNGVYDTGTKVTPGYSCLNRVVITNDITVRSVNGPECTVIKGAEAAGGGNGDDAVRGVYMSAGLLSGFTVTNGHTMTSGNLSYDTSGGGVNMRGGNGTITNCTLSGNSAETWGGGSVYGTLHDCTLSGNSAGDSGGGSYAGTLCGCTLLDNWAADYGGGSAHGTLCDCTLSGNVAWWHCGGGSFGGTLHDCTLSANSAWDGGGSAYGTLYGCTLTGNSAPYGGGSYNGALYGCTLSGNTAWEIGGGSYDATLNNCTLTGNSARRDGGGSYDGSLRNCIVYFNTADRAGDNWYGDPPDISDSCTTPLPSGTGNITNAPMLLSASHIDVDSPCVGAGSGIYASGNDIDGDPWATPPAMGCDEPFPPFSGTLQVAIVTEYTNVVVGHSLAFAAEIRGEPASNRWTFGDGTPSWNTFHDVRHAWSATGDYAVVLTAWNDDYPGGVSATVHVHVVEGRDSYVYVNATNPTPVPPYTSWSTAATNIQDAVDEASRVAGSTVWVTNGVYDTGTMAAPGYSSLNRVLITHDIVVRSVNGPEVTIIEGAEAGDGTGPVRGVYLTAGVLSGFTVTKGHTMFLDGLDRDAGGGGVSMYGGNGRVTDCVLSGNSAQYGGGSCRGTLYNCTLWGNSAEEGGGSYEGTLHNCTLSGNSAQFGGGSYEGSLRNCIVYHNTATDLGHNWHASTPDIAFSCTTPLPSGTGNITNAPMLLNSSHIHAHSPCVGAGSGSYASGNDIDGDAWGAPPAMGSDEPLPPFGGALYVSITTEYSRVMVEHELPLSAEISGIPASNRWTFGDGVCAWNTLHGVRHAWSATGDYAVVLTAWNDDHPGGVSATALVSVVDDSDYYVNAANPSPVPPYTSWQTAATRIQDAVGQTRILGADCTVWVTNGVYDTGTTVTPGYSCRNRVVITHNVVVRSVNGPEATIIKGAEASGGGNGDDAVRGVYMSAGVLSGFTVTNGHTMVNSHSPGAGGEVWQYDWCGGGVNMYGGSGVVINCTLTGNSARRWGGGSYCGTLRNCALIGNSAEEGGGSFQGTLSNCVLSKNSARHWGGGSRASTLSNCTLTGNSATEGGGSCADALRNCIVYFNTAAVSGDNWYGPTPDISYCCTTPLPSGTGNITSVPLLLTPSHIHARSPCVGAGVESCASGDDIDGESWASPPAMGCDEPLPPFSGSLHVSMALENAGVVVGHELPIFAEAWGEPASNRWTFGDGTSLWNTFHDVRHTWSAEGDYAVVLTVWNDDHPGGVSSTTRVHVVDGRDYYVYVNATNPTPVSPYSSWSTAATNIQDAVDAASGVAGSTVWVTNGVYNTGTTVTPGHTSRNRVVIMNNIIVRSVNGPEVTTIEGALASPGNPAVRGVYMKAGVLSGFTVTNGHTSRVGDYDYDESGGGVNMFGGDGKVSNCALSGNSAHWRGGGSYYGTLHKCTVSNNSVDYSGGGSYCATLQSCTVSGNSAGHNGGGSYNGTLNNCALLGNLAGEWGGGSCYGTLNNCTLSGNSAEYGGGSYRGTLRNCIVYLNTAGWASDNWRGDLPDISYSCTTPLPPGTGNVSSDPRFVDAANSDFRLKAASPCLDAGENGVAMFSGTDLNDNPRIFNGTVDMGAYEFTMTTQPRLLLQGAYDDSTHAMAASLSNHGLVPSDSPYAADQWTGNEVPSNTTDWVLAQLLDTNDLRAVASASGFLCNSGEVVRAEDAPGLRLECSPGHYYVVAKHRNHIAVMSAEPVAFTNDIVTYDFTTGFDKVAGGTNACVELEPGVWGMIAGDCDGDGKVTAADRAVVSNQMGRTGYLVGDLNLDGQVTKADAR